MYARILRGGSTATHYTWKESAGITDVIENRLDGNSVQNTFYKVLTCKAADIYGWDKPDSKHIRDMSVDFASLSGSKVPGTSDKIDANKFREVTKGVITALSTPNSVTDYSGGAIQWHFDRFSQKGTREYNQFYLVGFKFTDPSHNLWNMKDYPNPTKIYRPCGKLTVCNTVDYKYESTGAEGGSIFMKRTPESINAERKACNANYQPKNGPGIW